MRRELREAAAPLPPKSEEFFQQKQSESRPTDRSRRCPTSLGQSPDAAILRVAMTFMLSAPIRS
jgi:hypothetical protein